jgi:hypothetical protein
MPWLDAVTRNIGIGRLEVGESQNAVVNVITSIEARFHGFSNDTSSQTRQMTVHVLDVIVANHVQDRYIRVYQLRNRTVTASQQPLASLVYVGYLQIVRNFGVVLKCQHRRARMRWCNTVRIRDLTNWRRV